MFTSNDLDQYLVQQKLVGATADYIRLASSGLARDIGTSGYPCVVTEYQSRKMGTTVNTESRTGECNYAVHLDFDPNVIAFYEQPPQVDCYRTTKRKTKRLTNYIPDMLVLGKTGPFVVQVKLQRRLEALVATSEDWVQDECGIFHDLAAEHAFLTLQLPHIVVSMTQLDKRRATNISLLLKSLEFGSPDETLTTSITRYLAHTSITSLQALADQHGLSDLTPLLYLIATHRIFTDLSKFSLTEPNACIAAASPSLLRDDVYEAWPHFRRDPHHKLVGTVSQNLLPLGKHLARGVAIVDKLDQGLKGRSARRWIAKIKARTGEGLSRIAAASPRHDLQGNHNPKRPEIVLAYAEHVIRTLWTSVDRPSPSSLWRTYKTAAEEWHPDYKRLSAPTFRKLRDDIIDELAYARGGRRAANAAQPPTDVDDRALKAARPFEMASCDHYLCDLYCIVLYANGMTYVMQPWLTALRDCYTKSVLAFWLTLSPPSRRNCALVIRQCLRTHGRLPEWLIVDRGADFRSSYFSELMSHCRIHLMFRPPGHPRFGSEAERFFGQYQTLWLSARPGNRVCVREVRSVSGSHHPQKLACLTLLDFWEDLVAFNEWFDHYAVESSIASPAVLKEQGLRRFSCSGQVLPYDDRFVIATAVDDKTYALDRHRGLHIDAFHYWSPKLGQASASSLPVRRDPEDPYRVYALHDRSWVTCLASPAPAYVMRTPLEQAAEGAIMLSGTSLRTAVKNDADRALVYALRARQAAPSSPLVVPHSQDMAALSREVPTPDNDFFDEVSGRELAPLESKKWS
jgi:putative transposase